MRAERARVARSAAIVGAASFALAWGGSVVLADGPASTFTPSPVTWLIAFAGLGVALGYGAAAGWERAGSGVAGIPGSLRQVSALWGVAAGLVLVAVALPPPTSGATALLLIAVLATPLIGRVPERFAAIGPGLIVACLLGALIPGTVPRLALAAMVVAVAVALRRRGAATAAVLLAAAAALVVSRPAVSTADTTKHVTVASDKPWSARFDVEAGQQLTFRVSGRVHFLTGDDKAVADADGAPSHYTGCGGPTFCGALLGRVGAAAAPFAIGAESSMPVSQGGVLELTVNDYDFSDNSGSFKVAVTVGTVGSASSGASPSPGTSPSAAAASTGSRTSHLASGFLGGLGGVAGMVVGDLLGHQAVMGEGPLAGSEPEPGSEPESEPEPERARVATRSRRKRTT